LTASDAARRLAADGPNELAAAKKRHVLRIALELLREPMLLLLVACGGIYLILGDRTEAWLLLGSIAVVIGIELAQEQKAERALEALRTLSSPRALVIRDGQRVRIAGREVVRGDALVLAEGDRVPADAILRDSHHLSVDESLLTGESVPVSKQAARDGSPPPSRPGGDGQPGVFAGTLVVAGQGLAEVTATGARSEMGRIGKSLETLTAEETSVQRETARLVRWFAAGGLTLCVIIALVYGMTRGSWLEGALAGLTMAISMVPEELPVILTVFLALGAWRISRRGVLTRRIPALEMLGETTVLCTDKTGTLTLNKMAVQRLIPDHALRDAHVADGPLPAETHELVRTAILASQAEPFDPMDQALHALTDRLPTDTGPRGSLVRQYPLSQHLLAVCHVWRLPDHANLLAAAKGAPEAIADLCRLGGESHTRIRHAATRMASDGLRVLGVAQARIADDDVPDSPRKLPFEFVGLVGLADPVRPSAPDAIRSCRAAGIRVVMITGDYPLTAKQIARDAGLDPGEEPITGPELERLDNAALRERIRRTNVCARIVPEQKLRLINALKANGEIVAMTGDGVNDAPALKAAHIGVAMGARGTDVAREAASLVLVEDDFSSIVQAIRLGRRIFDNLKKAMAYIFAVHVPIAGMALTPVLLQMPLLLLPMHIVFLELIIDPACSIAFEMEPEESDVMQRPPRKPNTPLMSWRDLGFSVLQGAWVLLIGLAIFAAALAGGRGELETRALAFVSLVVTNLALIVTNRSWTRSFLQSARIPNPAIIWIAGGALAVLGLVLYVPWLQRLFHFAAPRPQDLALCLLAGLAGIAGLEGLKMRFHPRPKVR
jgi:Ca2+-transporting ATPase